MFESHESSSKFLTWPKLFFGACMHLVYIVGTSSSCDKS